MAKLRPEQLNAALKKQLSPVYMAFGDEALLAQEACDQIRSGARAAGFLERELYHNESGFDWNQVLEAANSLSLFADKKIIEGRLPTGKPGNDGAKALLDYAEAVKHGAGEDNILLLVGAKLDAATQRAKWFKALEPLGNFVQIWPIGLQQLPRWLEQRLKAANLRAEPGAIDILASRIEGNLLAGAQEIEKLKLLADNGVVSADLMASSVADSARYDVFGLIDKALHGDARGAVKNLHGLRSEGTDATVVLWALAREFRTLAQMAHLIAQGKNFDMAAKQSGVWDKRKPLIKGALRRFREPQLQQLLRSANGIDKAIKGMRKASAWDELLDLTLNLSGTQSLSIPVQRLALKL